MAAEKLKREAALSACTHLTIPLLRLQADDVRQEPELNGKRDGKSHQEDKPAAAAAAAAAVPDIQNLKEEGTVSPAGQGAAKAAEEYLGAPAPSNEKERHETLCACQILDTPPDPRFDDITKLVGLIVLM